MNARDILSALDVADEELLQEVDGLRTRKKPIIRWIAIAACLCLLCFAAWLLATSPQASEAQIQRTNTACSTESDFMPSESALPTEAVKLFEPYYNESSIAADGALLKDVCLFSQYLSEVDSFTPPNVPDWMELSGYAVFTGDGTLRQVVLLSTTNLQDVTAKINLAADKPLYDFSMPGKPRVSIWNGIEFTLWRSSFTDGSTELFAEASINGCFCTFSLHGSQDTRQQNEADFALILQTFAEADFGLDELSAIEAQEIPVMYDKTVTYEEALRTEPFGSFFPSAIPDGFHEESIRSYLDQYNAYLSGLWTRGFDELFWKVSYLTGADEQRMTHAEDTQRYDLSLYPIPRADSVPEELREVVDNPIFYAEELSSEMIWARAYKTGEQGDSDGWRMAFSVLCGDTVIEVRGKGVDPDWLYRQLLQILD